MVDRAERDAVVDPRQAARIAVLENVRSLEQVGFAQMADRAASCIGAKNRGAKAMLVQADEGLACRVSPDVLRRDEAGWTRVGEWQAGLQPGDPGLLIDGND